MIYKNYNFDIKNFWDQNSCEYKIVILSCDIKILYIIIILMIPF